MHTHRKFTTLLAIMLTLGAPVADFAQTNSCGTAKFYQPKAVTTDANGNIYVADTSNSRIRKIDTSGIVSTLYISPDSQTHPTGLAIAGDGNLYVSLTDCTIGKITLPEGTFSILSGAAGACTETVSETNLADARFNSPQGLSTDHASRLFVASSSNHIRQIDLSTGTVATLLNTSGGLIGLPSVYGTFVSGDGTTLYLGAGVKIYKIWGCGLDHKCNYVDIAGSVIGYQDGVGTQAYFGNGSLTVAEGGDGYLYVVDTGNQDLRRIDLGSYEVTTPVGPNRSTLPHDSCPLVSTWTTAYQCDGLGNSVLFNHPMGIGVDQSGNLLIGDTNDHTIRRVTTAGVVTTIAGSAGQNGSTDGTSNIVAITTQCGSQPICGSISTGVYASGDGLTFQWSKLKNGQFEPVVIGHQDGVTGVTSDANSSFIYLEDSQNAEGVYHVTVTNACGVTVTSNDATMNYVHPRLRSPATCSVN